MLTVYRVKKGDTFASIAKAYNLSAESIKRDNGFSEEVFEGARLILRPNKKVYCVKPFEKISDIAKNFGLSIEDLIYANALKKPYVYAGQILTIPDYDE